MFLLKSTPCSVFSLKQGISHYIVTWSHICTKQKVYAISLSKILIIIIHPTAMSVPLDKAKEKLKQVVLENGTWDLIGTT